MTQIELTVGDVFNADDIGLPSAAQSTVAGTQPIWAPDLGFDGFTISRSLNDGTNTFSGLVAAALSGSAAAADSFACLARFLPDAPGARPAFLYLHLRVDGIIAATGAISTAASGVQVGFASIGPAQIVGPFTFLQLTDAVAENRVEVAASISVPEVPAEYTTTVYDVQVWANYDDVPRRVPARRLWPRTDDLGLGTGRVYPPPNTPQSGGRIGSAAPY